MAKYQFFKRIENTKSEVRYLCTDSADFLAQKEALLVANFEVVGDMIYAKDENKAIAHFNSGMTYPLEEYNKSGLIGGLYYLVEGLSSATVNLYQRYKKNKHIRSD